MGVTVDGVQGTPAVCTTFIILTPFFKNLKIGKSLLIAGIPAS